ncbi:hypothetical protein VULLAG_LOCUS23168 [Vulpes lagopus]
MDLCTTVNLQQPSEPWILSAACGGAPAGRLCDRSTRGSVLPLTPPRGFRLRWRGGSKVFHQVANPSGSTKRGPVTFQLRRGSAQQGT